jgi:hypothetical protein
VGQEARTGDDRVGPVAARSAIAASCPTERAIWPDLLVAVFSRPYDMTGGVLFDVERTCASTVVWAVVVERSGLRGVCCTLGRDQVGRAALDDRVFSARSRCRSSFLRVRSAHKPWRKSWLPEP